LTGGIKPEKTRRKKQSFPHQTATEKDRRGGDADSYQE
jgi:hypothetical protein